MSHYNDVRSAIGAMFAAGWAHSDVPVYWRANDANPLPDPEITPYFLRNDVDFGREVVMAYGGGSGRNQMAQFGSVLIRVFAMRPYGHEDRVFDLLGDAMLILRSQRVAVGSNVLSFIGGGSGYGPPDPEDGQWFAQGAMASFEYRFIG